MSEKRCSIHGGYGDGSDGCVECDEKTTFQDYAQQIEKLDKILGKLQVPELTTLVARLRGKVQGELHKERMPLGLMLNYDMLVGGYQNVLGGWQPDISCRLTHLVLEPNSARLFNLIRLCVANVELTQWPMPTTGDCGIPLDTFSCEFVGNHELSAFHRWISPLCTPANRIVMMVQLRNGIISDNNYVPFRGVLWLEYSFP